MTDFIEPFRRAIGAAKEAQTNRDEISEIFGKFNEALYEMSNGTAEIARVPIEETMSPLSKFVLSFDTAKKSQQVIAVRHLHRPEIAPKQIARWAQTEAGYPCTLIYADRHASCDDAESLKQELSALFSTPQVGEALLVIMQPPPDKLQSDS